MSNILYDNAGWACGKKRVWRINFLHDHYEYLSHKITCEEVVGLDVVCHRYLFFRDGTFEYLCRCQ